MDFNYKYEIISHKLDEQAKFEEAIRMIKYLIREFRFDTVVHDDIAILLFTEKILERLVQVSKKNYETLPPSSGELRRCEIDLNILLQHLCLMKVPVPQLHKEIVISIGDLISNQY